jgi:hypothetical protein
MNTKLNVALVKKILECIPKNIKPIEYLMDLLDISRESVYRRMRGEIAFSFEEIAKLSQELNFMIDPVIGINSEKSICFYLREDTSIDEEQNFLAMLENYYKIVESISQASKGEMIASVNRLPLLLLIEFDNLFRFFYYKWIHQSLQIPVNHSFSEIMVSSDIMKLRDKFIFKSKTFDNKTFICCRNIFLTIVREIQYYHCRNLISKEDVLVLKKELIELLNNMKLVMQRGIDDAGRMYNLYFSLLDIEMNTTYATYDGNYSSQYWIYSVNSIIIKNHNICLMHKKWLESLRKSAILITQSNEKLQLEFINKQYEYIETVTSELTHY